MSAGLGKRDLTAQKLRLGSRSKSSEKFFLSSIFFFFKDPKRAVERPATFYSLSFSKYNKRGMGGVSKKQLKKKTA